MIASFRNDRTRWIGGAALLAVALSVGYVLRPRVSGTLSSGSSRWSRLPAAGLHSVELDGTGTMLVATGPDPYVVLPPPAVPIQEIRLELVPLGNFGTDFQMYFVPQSAPAPFSEGAVQSGRVLATPNGWRVEWELPEPVVGYRIDVPEGARFRVVALETSGPGGALASRAGSLPAAVLIFALALTLTLLAVQIVWRPFVPDLVTLKRASIVALAAPFAVLIFVLPPFQGPDEGAHWTLAMSFYRPLIASEPAAFRLTDILGTDAMPFHPELKFDPGRLSEPSAGPVVSQAELQEKTQRLRTNHPYSRFYTYPIVFAVSALFPPVRSVNEALVLFYLCRVAPALLLILVLLAADRRYDLPFTAVFFFSLPLVMQQFAIVSVDVFLNLAAVGAVLLFLADIDRPSRARQATLWVVTLAVVATKFILAGLLALPIALTLPRRRRALVIGAAVVAALALAYPFATAVWQHVRAYADFVHRGAQTDAQGAFLATRAGAARLISVYTRYLGTLGQIGSWSSPLGWLDTPLSAAHVSIIALSGATAVLLDVWRYVPAVRAMVTARAREIAWWVAVLAVSFLFATFVDVLLYYLMTTPPMARAVKGVQVRHFFPVAIAAVLAPMVVMRALPRWAGGLVVNTAAAVLIAVLLAARSVLLTFDLVSRYW